MAMDQLGGKPAQQGSINFRLFKIHQPHADFFTPCLQHIGFAYDPQRYRSLVDALAIGDRFFGTRQVCFV